MAERPVYNVGRPSMEYNGLVSVSRTEKYNVTPKSTLDMTYEELTDYWQKCRKKARK